MAHIFDETGISGNTPGGQSLLEGGAISALPPETTTITEPTVGAALGGTASVSTVPDFASQLESIKQQALAIQGQIPGATGEPTVGSVFAAPEPGAFGDAGIESYLRGVATGEVDPEAIRRNQLRLFQAEIDATNQVFDQMVREANIEGEGRLGSQRAIGARGGILGSDFAGAQKERVLGLNRDIVGGIQAERAKRIGVIMGTARKAAADEIAAKNTARAAGADAYLEYLGQKGERQQSNIRNLAAAFVTQGIDPTELNEEELTSLAKTYGTSEENIIAGYTSLKQQQDAAASAAALEGEKTLSEIDKNRAQVREIDADIASGKIKTIGEGTMLYNTETGETFKNPKTFAPGSGSSLSIGAGNLTQDQVASVHQLLDESRGGDKYADTGKYLDEMSGFVALGGDPKDFIKEYDPDVYINPTDETRSFLKAFMKKQDTDLFLGSLGGIDLGGAIEEAKAGG